jgi:hypothetical protein
MDGIDVETELNSMKEQSKSDINDLMEFNGDQTPSIVIQENESIQ